MGAPPFGSRPQSGSQMSIFSTLQLQTWVVALQDALSISAVCEAKAEGDPRSTSVSLPHFLPLVC